MATKFSFGANGEVKKDENYILTDEDITALESSNDELDDTEHEEYVADQESSMEPKLLKLWLQEKSKGMSIHDFLAVHGGTSKASRPKAPSKPKGHSRQPSKVTQAKRRMGRQETLISCRDKEAIKRTYVIEIENLKRLEEIKVYLYQDQVIQFSEIVNDAIEHYFNCLKADNK